MDFGRQRGFVLDGETRLGRWAVEGRVIFWSSCVVILPGIFVSVVFMSFFTVPRAPTTTGTVVVLSSYIRSTSISKSSYLLNFSVVVTKVLVSRGIIMSMRRQCPSCSLAQCPAY